MPCVSDHPALPVRTPARRTSGGGRRRRAGRPATGPALIAAGAAVEVISPDVTPAIEGLVHGGEVVWEASSFVDADLDDAWYVVAATDSSETNAAVSAAAERRRIFCVRSDDASAASAWTPAAGTASGITVGVLGNREPRRSAAIRDEVLEGLREGRLGTHERPETVPGVTLVGGGPGDPELLTLAGRRALMEADVVVADRLAPREALGDLPGRRRALRRREAAPRSFGAAGGDQPDHRRASACGPPCRALQGRRQLRVRSRLRGGHRVPRGRRAGHGDPRRHQPRSRAGHGRHPGDPPRAWPTSSPSSPVTCHRATPVD